MAKTRRDYARAAIAEKHAARLEANGLRTELGKARTELTALAAKLEKSRTEAEDYRVKLVTTEAARSELAELMEATKS